MSKSNPLDASISFIGAAQTVTGSKTRLNVNGKNFLIDCGLFQGSKAIRELNWEKFEQADKIEAIILTHAHIDHSGYLPKIVKDGFTGPIYCSEATAELCEILLMDAAYLQEEDAHFANRTKHSKHNPAKPLYTSLDAYNAIKQLRPIVDSEWFSLSKNLSVKFERSGHILGSRFVQLDIHGNFKRISCTFSGDLGNGRSLILKDPVIIPESNVLVLESTYGNRIQEKIDPSKKFSSIINTVYAKEGVLVIPAFSIGRTQELLFLIDSLKQRKLIPNIKVYLDSPMSTKTTAVYEKHLSELKPVLKNNMVLNPLAHIDFECTKSTDESMLLCMQDGPFIVISAAGMLTGGRILHHLKRRLPDENNAVLFSGYQAAETKGRLLQSGIESLRIHHQEIEVCAQIHSLESLSAHADQDTLLNWLSHVKNLQKLFLNHGEIEQMRALKEKIKKELNINAVMAEPGEKYNLL